MIRIENIKDEMNVYVSGIMDDAICSEISNSIKLGAAAGTKTVLMHINSYGGSVSGAWDIISTIKNAGLKFKAINEGFAISAASILLASADESQAFDYSTSMIHDPLLGGTTLEKTTGPARELLTAIKDGIMTVLNNRLKMPIEQLSNLLKKETSWNAQEQLSFGLVDSIITTSSKPQFSNEMDYKTICNIIDVHNNLQNNINNMSQEEIDALVAENEMLKARIVELETPVEPIEEVAPAVEPETPEEPIEEAPIEEAAAPVVPEEPIEEEVVVPVEEPMKNELNILKVENFILKNKLENKSEMIENAVSLHGIEVLNTIISFINNDSAALENKVAELQNTLVNVANVANDSIDSIINNTGVTNYEAMAEEIFGMGADDSKRLLLKDENPTLHEKLFNVYYNLEE